MGFVFTLSPYSLMEFLDSVSLPLMLQLGSFISPFFFFTLLFFSALYTSCICIKFLINCNYLLKKIYNNVSILFKNYSFRMFSNEDVTIGAWMLAMNVNHENNQALCAPECSESSIAVWDIPKCSGWCFFLPK